MTLGACVTNRHGEYKGNGEGADYSYLELYRLYNISEAVWRGDEEFRQTEWNLEFFDDEETRTIGMSFVEDGVLYITFRATSSDFFAADSQYNLMIGRRTPSWHPEFSPVSVHRGFLTRYERVRDRVYAAIVRSEAQRIVFTGSSAGGALTLLAFVDVAHSYPEIDIEHISFGAPRIFDSAAVRWINRLLEERPGSARTLRVVNGNDRIPSVPPALTGYRHIGDHLHIGPPRRRLVISAKDHQPGYRTTLRTLLKEEGVDLERLPWSRG